MRNLIILTAALALAGAAHAESTATAGGGHTQSTGQASGFCCSGNSEFNFLAGTTTGTVIKSTVQQDNTGNGGPSRADRTLFDTQVTKSGSCTSTCSQPFTTSYHTAAAQARNDARRAAAGLGPIQYADPD